MKYKEPEIVVPELEKLVGTYKTRWWSAEDTAKVAKYFGRVPLDALAKEVRRPPEAVYMKAKRMGLSTTREAKP